MFIGGLSLNTEDDSLREYFEKWGETTDAVVMREPGTKRSRGFGFVTYVSSDSVDKCLAEKPHILDDKEVREIEVEKKNGHSMHLAPPQAIYTLFCFPFIPSSRLKQNELYPERKRTLKPIRERKRCFLVASPRRQQSRISLTCWKPMEP